MQTKLDTMSELLDRVEMVPQERAKLKITADKIEFICDYLYSKASLIGAFRDNLRKRFAATDLKQKTT